MRKPASSVEWIVAKSDADWERLPALPPTEVPSKHRLNWQRYLWCLGIVLLVSVGGWWGHTSQTTLPSSTPPGAMTAQLGSSSIASSHRSLIDIVVGDSPITDWRRPFNQAERDGAAGQVRQRIEPGSVQISRIEYLDDRAIVSIVTTAKGAAPAYRQTHIYQRTAAGWQQTEPVATLWGPEHSLETASFIYHFRQHDAQAVAAVAPQIDALYATMQHNFGLPIRLGTEKLSIEVSVTSTPGVASSQARPAAQFSVASPALYRAPVALTDAQILAQSIALPLLDYALTQAVNTHRIGLSWQPMLNGLRLWQLWDLDLPLARWRPDVVKWLYADISARDNGRTIVLPAHYSALCMAHQLWMPYPWQLHIPLFCTERDRQPSSLFVSSPQDVLIQLDQLAPSIAPEEYIGQSGSSYVASPGQAIALATVIEYGAATYGRERLPVLVVGLGQYTSWDTLLPAVYGVSPAAFEAGWQAYLVAHYGVDAATFTP